MIRKTLASICIPVVLLFCANAHAIQVEWLLQQLSARAPMPEKIEYKNPSGTVMQGKLEHLIYDGRDLGELSWVLDAPALLNGKIAMNFSLGKGSPFNINAIGRLESGADKVIHLKDIKASMPAVSVIDLARRIRLYEPKGDLHLHIRSGSVNHNQLYCETLDGTASWSEAQINLPSGNYNAQDISALLGCKDHAITVNMQQDSAQFSSQSDMILFPNNRYDITGWLEPRRSLSNKMQQKLSSLGKQNAQGKIILDTSGKL